MRYFQQIIPVVIGSLLLCLLPVRIASADPQEAADMYNQAQKLKRAYQFENARVLFETIADMDDSGTWGDLASDELRYGLPLYEADQWILKYGRASRNPQKQDQYRENAETLLGEIIEQNTDNPQRVQNVQQKLDQLASSAAYLDSSRDFRLRSSLAPLRHSFLERFQMYGNWPEEEWVRDELAKTLKKARFPEDKLVIDTYWLGDTTFRLQLVDHKSNRGVVITGDENGVRME